MKKFIQFIDQTYGVSTDDNHTSQYTHWLVNYYDGNFDLITTHICGISVRVDIRSSEDCAHLANYLCRINQTVIQYDYIAVCCCDYTQGTTLVDWYNIKGVNDIDIEQVSRCMGNAMRAYNQIENEGILFPIIL